MPSGHRSERPAWKAGTGTLGRLDAGALRYQCLLRRWLDVARVAEFQVLGSTAFGELLRDTGVSLWPMSQILANRA